MSAPRNCLQLVVAKNFGAVPSVITIPKDILTEAQINTLELGAGRDFWGNISSEINDAHLHQDCIRECGFVSRIPENYHVEKVLLFKF